MQHKNGAYLVNFLIQFSKNAMDKCFYIYTEIFKIALQSYILRIKSMIWNSKSRKCHKTYWVKFAYNIIFICDVSFQCDVWLILKNLLTLLSNNRIFQGQVFTKYEKGNEMKKHSIVFHSIYLKNRESALPPEYDKRLSLISP